MFFSTSCVSSRHFWITLCSLSDDSWEFSLCHANKWILKVIVIIIYYLFLYAWCTCNSLDPAEAVVPFQKSSWKVLIYDNLPTPSNKMNIEQRSPSFLRSAEKQWCILPILKVSNQITIEMCVKKEKKINTSCALCSSWEGWMRCSSRTKVVWVAPNAPQTQMENFD